MIDNAFKRSLLSGQPLVGLWANLDGLVATEVLAATPGVQWVGIDCEHTPRAPADVLAQLRVLAGTAAAPVVRTAGHDPGGIGALLDIGVVNLLVPHVDTPQQAAALVRAVHYPPAGQRGFASGQRAGAYGRRPFSASTATADLCLIAMVETGAALAQITSIAAVAGVDAVYIGAADLACDIGHAGQPAHPEVQRLIRDAIAAVAGQGQPVGISVQSRALREAYAALGASFFAIGQDVLVHARALERHVADMLGTGTPDPA